MSVPDMIRLCTMSGTAIVAAMLLLGVMMIWQKPEARLELASIPGTEQPAAAMSEPLAVPAIRLATADAKVASSL